MVQNNKDFHLAHTGLIRIFLIVILLSESSISVWGADPTLHFSVSHGFYYSPVTVVLGSELPGSVIYYTTNGSWPSASNGTLYVAPLTISGTTVLRAVDKSGETYGKVVTSSFLFPQDIIRQPDNPAGYPAYWGNYTAITGTAIADYEMDPEIVDHADYKNLLIPSLLSVPTVSIATNRGYLFSQAADPDTGGIYIYTGANGGVGDNWERPVSVELIIPGSPEGFQVDCGMQIQGGAGRLAEKNPKHSFRLAFRDAIGPGKLKYPLFGDEPTGIFNGVVLRASFGNTWRHWETGQRNRANHITDIWAKDTQLEMGYAAAHSRYVHLYLNGIYWGLYNFSERLDDDFMASYFGGTKEDYDVIKDYNELMDGSKDAWNHLWNTVNANIADPALYQRLIGNNPDGTHNGDYPPYVDPVNLCDYMLINFFGGNNDWDHHNWVAARNRVNPGKGFSFFCWDTEKIFENVNENYVNENNAQRPSGIFRKLLANAEFKLLFADRAHLHLNNNGLLTPERVAARWQKRADEIDTAMIAESARWGDYRRDVHPYLSGPYYLYTWKEFWLKEQNRLIDDYYPVRTQIVLNQLKNAGLLPEITAPVFSQHGGEVAAGFMLNITAALGTIYYTLDGTDPRKTGGTINTTAKIFTGSIRVDQPVEVKARARQGDVWSVLTSALFPPGITDEVTEIPGIEKEMLKVYPNPFNDQVSIRYCLPEKGNALLSVYRSDGRLVSSVPLQNEVPGEHIYVWQPEHPEPGVYFIRLSCGNYNTTHKLICIGH